MDPIWNPTDSTNQFCMPPFEGLDFDTQPGMPQFGEHAAGNIQPTEPYFDLYASDTQLGMSQFGAPAGYNTQPAGPQFHFRGGSPQYGMPQPGERSSNSMQCNEPQFDFHTCTPQYGMPQFGAPAVNNMQLNEPRFDSLAGNSIQPGLAEVPAYGQHVLGTLEQGNDDSVDPGFNDDSGFIEGDSLTSSSPRTLTDKTAGAATRSLSPVLSPGAIADTILQDALDNEESQFEFSSATPPNLDDVFIDETSITLGAVEYEFPALQAIDPIKLAYFLKLPYNPGKTFTNELAEMGDKHLDFLWDNLEYLLHPKYRPENPDALTPPVSPIRQDFPNDDAAANSGENPQGNGKDGKSTEEMIKTLPSRSYGSIYPAYSHMFKTGKQASDARKETQVPPAGQAPDLERVKKYGRYYWTARLYNSMIDVSRICDGPTSTNTKRFTEKSEDNFTARELEACAHHIFDHSVKWYDEGWCRPGLWFSDHKRGPLVDSSVNSVEKRLADICQCLTRFKACADDALRGGLTLDQLVANPGARLDSKLSNAHSNLKRSINNQKAQEVLKRNRTEPEEPKTRVKRAKGMDAVQSKPSVPKTNN